jgi:hypothetical protein
MQKEQLTGNIFLDVFLRGPDVRWAALEMFGVAAGGLLILVVLVILMCVIKDCIFKKPIPPASGKDNLFRSHKMEYPNFNESRESREESNTDDGNDGRESGGN